jgi:hypothetical protein
MKIIWLMSFALAMLSTLRADVSSNIKPLKEGKYRMNVSASVIAEISVCLEVRKDSKVTMQIVWIPGVELDFEGNAKRDIGGWIVEFENDNFGNSGLIKISQESSQLIKATVIAKKKVEGRALRQYGEYRLVAKKSKKSVP